MITLPIFCFLIETCSQVHHFDGCDSTFVALIAVDSTCAVLGLLHGVSGDKAKDYGDATLSVQLGNALCGACSHVVEVRCVATHHAAECDDCIHLAALHELG